MNDQHPRIIIDHLQTVKTSFEKLVRHYFGNLSLTMPQILLILLLNENGPMNISEISKKMGLSKSTVSGIIDRLEKMALVKRDRSKQDRRIISVGLTEKYDNTGLDIEHKFREFLYNIFNEVSEEEFVDIIKGLTKLDQIISQNFAMLDKSNFISNYN